MHNKIEWNSKALHYSQKKAHSANLIGLSHHTSTTFFTSSEDATVRLWDIRTQSSIKLIRNKCLSSELSNPATDYNNSIFVGSQKLVYEFDIRKQLIFIEQISKLSTQPHYDNINHISYSIKNKQLLCCDDEGDIRVYKSQEKQLKCVNQLQQMHLNICNTVKPIQIDKKQFNNKRICVSGGFDSTLIIWDQQQQKPIKKIAIIDILEKYQIKTQNQSFPFIHSLAEIDSNVLVAIESGHILCLPILQPRKPKFILQANLTRVTDCKVAKIHNKNFLLCCAIDQSFSLFDYQQRVDGVPKFLQKYKTIGTPIQVEYIGYGAGMLLVVSENEHMGFYQIKG